MNNNYNHLKRINCLANELDLLYHQAARKLGVSDSVLCILYMIHEKGDGCLLRDICSESSISKQTINSALRNLEKEEILYLEQDNGKNKRIRLTEKGKRYTAHTAVRLFEAEASALADWSEEDLSAYLYLMKKYNDCFRLQVENMDKQ